MRELSFKMVIRAYLICALMTSILGIISCSVHDIINWFPIVLLYAWIILSPISILALITVYLLGVQRDWICKIPIHTLTHDFSLFTYQKYSYGVCLCLYNVTLQ